MGTVSTTAGRPGAAGAAAAADVTDVAVSAQGLTKAYGDFVAVDHLDLQIHRHEIFGLLGPNGAGKTTTILMMLGLTEPTAGSVTVDGLDPRSHPLEVKQVVGYLPDDVGFYDHLTARENLAYTAALNRMPRRAAAARLDEVLELVGLAGVGDKKVGAFSRGMRQRLGLADALVKRPKILVLDEPTVNIDPEGVRELLTTVDRLRRDEDVTVLLSSHLLHQVEQICDRMGIFVAGRLVALGSLGELAAGIVARQLVEVGVSGEEEAAAAAIVALPGVTGLDRSTRPWLVTATPEAGRAIGHAVVGAGADLWHLRRQDADLDAIYHRYFVGSARRDGERADEPADQEGAA
ncbi:MAG: ABC transporter ATP-binding protein [Acidimicrobiales bacterium]